MWVQQQSRVVHVALTNPQTFGFEFHLRSLPCAFSRKLAVVLFCCYIVLTRPNKVETAVYGYIFDFQFGLYHVVVPFSFLRSISLA